MSHPRISVKTRCVQVITAVNNGTPSHVLSKEYGVTWATIRDAIRNDHYKVTTNPANIPRYKAFLKKVRANDAAFAAQANEPDACAISSEPQEVENTTLSADDSNTPCINLVETGVLMHQGIEHLLTLDQGNAVFMVPRFCIKELKNILRSRNTKDSAKEKARTALLKLYAEGIWNVRFIPFEPVEQGLIPRTPDVRDYKSRSFGIAEATLELYIDTNCRVNVMTTSMEVQRLVNRAISDEELGSDITVTRMYSSD